jgi:hypothetical protein
MTLRSNTVRMGIVAILAAGLAALVVVLLFPGQGTSAAPAPSPLVPLAADWDFDDESWTNQQDPGIMLYDKVVYTPAGANTLYVTFSGTGDQHDDAQTLMYCSVDGVGCSGDEWVVLQLYDDFDFHDNAITYTWCKAITPAAKGRHVNLQMASSNGGTYVEQMHFYVSVLHATRL